ncbi:hypothetical protein IU459_13135 [Nocardia amamiensis]|uniref:Uncharacterized protein n=1 Tax=Nocardia amamiensis TaxID=404578 RepID=A0ABS0CUM5_9NOCA|nr:hypothetical protein [Nocardia amamiensis]MBF6298483.1 hypothetical protein [Nocardia amamiensis]
MSYRLSPRDMLVLMVLAEMYGAPLELVAYMLGVSRSWAYRIVAKWQKAHMISANRVRPVPGSVWIYPTRSACEALLGRSVRYWVPTPKMAAHTRAVLELRLALTGLDLDRWISERSMRGEVGLGKAGQPRPHIHDGRYITSSGELWAVEVELTAKNLAAARTSVAQALHVARRADCAGLTYYCRGEAVKNVIRTAAAGLDLSDGPKLRLVDLDELLVKKNAETSTSLASRPGLRVIAGGAADHEIPQVADPNEGKAV